MNTVQSENSRPRQEQGKEVVKVAGNLNTVPSHLLLQHSMSDFPALPGAYKALFLYIEPGTVSSAHIYYLRSY